MESKLPRDNEYFKKVIKLNRSFVAWINDFMNKSPDYDFSPVCNDYLKFISKLRKEYPLLIESDTGTSTLSKEESKKGQEVIPKKLQFQPNLDMTSSKLTQPSSSTNVSPIFKSDYFSMPNLTSSSPLASSSFAPSTSFASSSTFKPSTTFTSSSTFTPSSSFPSSTFVSTFGTSSSTQSVKDEPTSKNNDEDGEDYVPPESSPVIVEEDALYTVKCKLYYKKDKKFTEKGLGHLYIKSNEGKCQLVIRAENANATILLNIHLQKSLPIVCSENGVLLTCIPNPPLSADDPEEKKTVTFFIKVKNKLAASKLHDKLEEYKSD